MDELQLGVEHQHGPGRPELAPLQLEESEGAGEVAVTVGDDGKLDALGDAGGTAVQRHLEGRGGHHHGPDGDVAVGADPHHLRPHFPEVPQSVAELLPLARLYLRQFVVHEDEDSELALQLLRSDADELQSFLGLGDTDHGELAEGVHEGEALAGLAGHVWGQQVAPGLVHLLGGGRLLATHRWCVCLLTGFKMLYASGFLFNELVFLKTLKFIIYVSFLS